MAEITIRKWTCDRCDADIDKRPQGWPRAEIEALVRTADIDDHIDVVWRDLCPACNDIAIQAIKILAGQVNADG